MPSTDADQPHFGMRFERTLAAKLGRCPRCMTWSAALLAASWALVIGLAATAPPLQLLLVPATPLATGATVLAAAHLVAYARRRRPAPSGVAVTPAPATERGCGCGGRATPLAISGAGLGE